MKHTLNSRADWSALYGQYSDYDGPVIVEVIRGKKTRSWLQNRLMWALLTDISAQVEWHGKSLSKEEWKDMLTASQKQQKVVPGIDGGFVVLGAHTSKMSVAEMADLITLCLAFGHERGVKFSAPKHYYEV